MIYNNKKTKNLTEFQQKNIEERKSLDFFKELDRLTESKKIFSKIFSQQIETLVQKFDERGIMFYSVKIELPSEKKKDNFWESVHQDVEEFINYIGSHIELIEFSYFAIEMKGRNPVWQGVKTSEQEMLPCINGIIGVRSILGKNKSLFFELKDLFFISHYDIKFESFSNISEIIKYWNFVIKQKNFKFHRFVSYSDFYPMVYGAIADEELKFDDRYAFSYENHFISDTMNVSGVNKKIPKKRELLLYFFILFMQQKNLRIHKNNIYLSIENSKISWQLVCSLEQIKKKFQKLFDKLQILYPQQLVNFNIMDLLLSDLDPVFLRLNKNNSLLPEIEKFDNVIEFKDGIFFLETGKFFSFFSENNFCSLRTVFFIDCSFFELNSAEFWLKWFKLNKSEFNSNSKLLDLLM